jgi:hypothetical protein
MNRQESLVGKGNGDASISAQAERRKRARIRVHWRIVLSRDRSGEGASETTTEDLSSDGFYCFSMIPFVAGELLFCRLYLPTADSGCGASHLECRVRVVSVEKSTSGDNYGLACLTEDYDVIGCSGDLGPSCRLENHGLLEPYEKNQGSCEGDFPSVP